MRASTDRFGDIDVDDERVLTFPDGLPGFPEASRFVLIDIQDNGVFFWLQSLDDPALAFMAGVPWPFFPDYEPELPEDDQSSLALDDAADALVLCLITIHDPEEAEAEQPAVTANLLGPVVVNQRTRVGRQVVLADSKYPVRAALPA